VAKEKVGKAPETREAAALKTFRREFAAEDFATDVEAALEKLGMSRADLARRLDCTPAFVTKALRRTSNLTVATMTDIAAAVGIEELRLRVPNSPGHVKPRDQKKSSGLIAGGLIFPHETGGFQYTIPVFCSDDFDWAQLLSGPTNSMAFEFPSHYGVSNDNAVLSPPPEEIVQAQAGKPMMQVLQGGRGKAAPKNEEWTSEPSDNGKAA
jgi:transcriptional regulator with XRE-family HTH domain